MSAAREASGGRVLGLSVAALDLVMPMHVWVGPAGRVTHAGRTLRKLVPELAEPGALLFTALTIDRPRPVDRIEALLLLHGQRLGLRLNCAPDLSLKGLVVALPGGVGALLDLSLGVATAEAVRRFGLTLSDFAHTDLSVEMLFLNEANAAVLAESRRLNAQLNEARTEAELRAQTDALTGLANRRAMDGALADVTRPPVSERFGVMQIDLDHFKAVNDELGHAAGDHVLTEVARILQEETRKDDIAARVGGDEFVLILRDCDDPELMTGIARRIIARLEEPIPYGDAHCRISASVGLTFSSCYAAPRADALLSDADAATYVSKREGRGRVTVAAPG